MKSLGDDLGGENDGESECMGQSTGVLPVWGAGLRARQSSRSLCSQCSTNTGRSESPEDTFWLMVRENTVP